jgi:hypothetical protein
MLQLISAMGGRRTLGGPVEIGRYRVSCAGFEMGAHRAVAALSRRRRPFISSRRMAMNAPNKLALIFSAVAIALPQAASAKSAAISKSWTGTWQLSIEKSKFSSADYTPKSDTRTYSVAGKRLTMRATGTNAAGKTMKWSYSANTNGKWYPTSGNPNTDHIALTLVSPREFTSKTTLKGKPSAKSTATLSDDGKVITIKRSILTAKGGPTDDTLVFDRTK